MPTDPEDGLPLLTWQDVPRQERIVIVVLTLVLLVGSIAFYVWIGSAALSAW